MALPGINTDLINGGGSSSGAPSQPTYDLVFSPPTLRASTFGVPSAFQVMWLGPAASLYAGRFGLHSALQGMPPNDWILPASSLVAGKFGVPSRLSMLQAGPVQSLQSSKFGTPVARVALNAASLAPLRFGVPSSAINTTPSPLRPVRFGIASTWYSMDARPLTRAKFGLAKAQFEALLIDAQSLRPVQFGELEVAEWLLSSRALKSVRFGTPVVDRGNTC